MNVQLLHDNDMRLVRHAIINAVPLPPKAVARLEARGVNVGELEARIRQQFKTGGSI
jgi:hypothetical protein